MTNENLLSILGDIDGSFISNAVNSATCTDEMKTMHSKRKMKAKKILLVAAIASVFVGSVTALACGPLKDTWVAKIMVNDHKEVILHNSIHLVHISENAPKQALDTPLTILQAEDMLGIDLLSSPMMNKEEGYYRPTVQYYEIQPDGKRWGESKDIERVALWYASCLTYEGNDETKSISMSIVMITDKATASVIPDNDPIDAAGDKQFAEKYHVEGLGADAVICTTATENGLARITAELCYKDVYYEFIGMDMTVNEMVEFLGTLA